MTAERKYKQVAAEMTQQLQIFVAYLLDLSGCLLFAPNDTTTGRWVCRRCTVCKYWVLPAKVILCLCTVCPEVLACSATCCIIVDSMCNALEQHQKVTLQPHKLWFTNSNVVRCAQLAIQQLFVLSHIKIVVWMPQAARFCYVYPAAKCLTRCNTHAVYAQCRHPMPSAIVD